MEKKESSPKMGRTLSRENLESKGSSILVSRKKICFAIFFGTDRALLVKGASGVTSV